MFVPDRTAVSLVVGMVTPCDVGTDIDREGEESEG